MFNEKFATAEDFIRDIVPALQTQTSGKKAICALSGGVDSAVAAVLAYKAIGKNLTCVYVDTGLMRLHESDEVEAVFRGQFDIPLVRVDKRDYFLAKLAGVTDPEQKRKIIGEAFVRVFEEEAKKLGVIECLVQGTIYPDIVESGSPQSGLVKSHHNVGGLPEAMSFSELVEPLRTLYKDEVRKVGLALGMPEKLIFRQPFPGPGLAVRCIGEVTGEKLNCLRLTDFILRDEIAKAGLDREIWQYFTVLTGVRAVGVKHDVRTYGHVIAIRAVHSTDAMTAEWARIPYEVLACIAERLINEVPDVSRVVYDITAKPPGTIEWE